MRAGFTLIETLVALAVFGLLITSLLQAERAFRHAEADEDQALRVQQAQAMVELLRAELTMAGYRNAGTDLQVASSPASDRIAYRYLEDRLADAPAVRTVTLEAGVDARGSPSLYRRVGSAYRQPAVAGLAELRVIAWLDRAEGAWRATPPTSPAAMRIRLSFAWGDGTEIVVGFPNAPTYGALEDPA